MQLSLKLTPQRRLCGPPVLLGVTLMGRNPLRETLVYKNVQCTIINNVNEQLQ